MIKNTKIIPKPLIPINELPRWAYSESEWTKIELQTMAVVDDVRMEYDYDKWARLKYKDVNGGMDRLGLI